MLCLNPLCNSPKKFNQKYLLYTANWYISKAIFSLICIKWSASSKIFDKKQYVSLKGEILWMLRFMMRLILQTLYLENKSNLFLYSDIKSRLRGDTKVYKTGDVKKRNETIKRGGTFERENVLWNFVKNFIQKTPVSFQIFKYVARCS